MSVNFEAGAQPDGLIILNLILLAGDSMDVKSSHLKDLYIVWTVDDVSVRWFEESLKNR